MRGGVRGAPIMRGQVRPAVRGMQHQGQRGGQQYQRKPPAPPIPEKLANMNSLSIIRKPPVELPKDVRLPSSITLSHPRGIQNQPPPAPATSSYHPAQPQEGQ